MNRDRLGLRTVLYASLIVAAIFTLMVVTNPFFVIPVIALAVVAYAILTYDMARHPVQTNVVHARRTMGRNVPRDWDRERRDVELQVELERGSIAPGFNFRAPQPAFKRSKWARRRE